MNLHIVTTCFAPAKALLASHRESIASQTEKHEYHFIDASQQVKPKTAMENMVDMIKDLPPEDVVLSVDGDDALKHPGVLTKIKKLHEKGAWVTYGSYEWHFGGASTITSPLDHVGINTLRGVVQPRGACDPTKPRVGDFRTTHLKTFRAGLFQRLREIDTHLDGTWRSVSLDRAFMFPMCEMAGRDRVVFVPEVLYVYSGSNSTDAENARGTLASAQIALLPSAPLVKKL